MPHRFHPLGRHGRRGGLMLGLIVGVAIAVPFSFAASIGSPRVSAAPMLAAPTLFAQAQTPATAPIAAADLDRLRPGDVVRVELNEVLGPGRVTEVIRAIRVDGTIRLPFVGSVKVGGVDNFDATAAISKALKDRGITSNGESYIECVFRPDKPAEADTRIQPGDSLVIEVWDLRGPGDRSTMRRRVSYDGRAMPMFIPAMRLQGLTADEAEEQIAKTYSDRGLVDKPIVLVTIEPKPEPSRTAP